jgi:hypothetical protein
MIPKDLKKLFVFFRREFDDRHSIALFLKFMKADTETKDENTESERDDRIDPSDGVHESSRALQA